MHAVWTLGKRNYNGDAKREDRGKGAFSYVWNTGKSLNIKKTVHCEEESKD